MSVIFATLVEALKSVVPDDDRSLMLVKFKAKEFFCLALSENDALAAVAEAMGAECGAVPLDLILRAHREQLEEQISGNTAAKGSPNKIKLSSLDVGEMKTIFRERIAGKFPDAPAETAGIKRAAFVGYIATHLAGEFVDDKGEGTYDPKPEATPAV